MRDETLTLRLSPARLRWLREMAAQRGLTIEQCVTNLVHNETLDYQMAHYPESHPDMSPVEARITHLQGE